MPSRLEDSLLLLDFARSSAAGCYVHGSGGLDPSSSSDSSSSDATQLPSAVATPLSLAAVCAAAHPRSDLLVAGGMQSCLSLVGLQ